MERVPIPVDVVSIFASLHGCHLVLLPDAPRFTIVEATGACLAASRLLQEGFC